jgi:hypothetical protein
MKVLRVASCSHSLFALSARHALTIASLALVVHGCTTGGGEEGNNEHDDEDSSAQSQDDSEEGEEESSTLPMESSQGDDQTSSGSESNTDPSTTSDSDDPATSDASNDAESSSEDESSQADSSSDEEIDEGLALLGHNSHALDNINLEILGTSEHGLLEPTDVEIHPMRPEEAWVTNRSDNAVIVFANIDDGTISAKHHNGDGSQHFLPRPSALSFGTNGFFATAHEEDRPTQGNLTPWDFMGPTLWLSDPGKFNGDHPTHYDMLHNSPNAVGIAWETGNVYWLFDGTHNSLTRYDFAADHGPGATDHSDGTLRRYVEGEVKYVPDVVSHLHYDLKRNLLYVADTGNARVAVLDPQSGQADGIVEPNYDSKNPNAQVRWSGALLTTLVDGGGSATYLPKPAGLVLHDDMLFVSDHEASYIYAFDLGGEIIDWLDTERPSGSLQGMSFDPQGRLYVVDSRANELIRISAKVEGR